MVCAGWVIAAPHAAGLPAAQDLWLAPSAASLTRPSSLAQGIKLLPDEPAKALPFLQKSVDDPRLGGYARLYVGRAQLALGQNDAATQTASALLAAAPTGSLEYASRWFAADAADAKKDYASEIKTLQTLIANKPDHPERAWMRLARAAESNGDRQLAADAYSTLYYYFVGTSESDEASTALAKMTAPKPFPAADPSRHQLDLGRAQQLYGSKRYSDSRKAFDLVRPASSGDERTLVELRIAECDFYLKKLAAARDELKSVLDKASPYSMEAQYIAIASIRDLGSGDEYASRAKAFADSSPDGPWIEETLNDLARYYILADDDASAAKVYTTMYARFPTGSHAEIAAWRAGWWAYKTGEYADAIHIFDTAALGMRHADTRPSWVYWSARAHEKQGDREAAIEGFKRVIADYRNSYYGREAVREIETLTAATARRGAGPIAPVSPAKRELPPTIVAGEPPDNAALVRGLLESGLYSDAIAELRLAQQRSGDSPVIEATIAYAYNRNGDLRPGIQTMRRAYPQFLAEGGEALPADLREVIFPVNYWELIYKYATAHNLDPYLMTALIVQESTFEPAVKSSANAWGLMQLVPATGRRYAASLGIRPFSTSRLTEPDVNIRIGMAYFADLVKQFNNSVPAALASYNAGENRVARWIAERPGVDRDEFIDDIPFTETQGYVRRIIGQAEDYRLLYRKPGATTGRAGR
jgi:soluble lytic murein transglycosylase